MNSLKRQRNQTPTRRPRQAYRRPTPNIRPTSTHSALDTSLGYHRIPPIMRWL
jgi:hypothetical protein